VSGQFLIDSESNLQASFMRMGDTDEPVGEQSVSHAAHQD
jgi:hypothetical protein